MATNAEELADDNAEVLGEIAWLASEVGRLFLRFANDCWLILPFRLFVTETMAVNRSCCTALSSIGSASPWAATRACANKVVFGSAAIAA